MTLRIPQTNFSKGEIGPQLRGRFDVDAWNAGLARARNVCVLKYGGVTRRPGTQLVAEVIDPDHPTRLIPFQFSLTQARMLEMGHGYMSPCAAGGRILEDELAITAITNAAQAQVTVAYHGLVAGDLFYIVGVAGAMGTLLNGRVWRVVTVIDAARFTIAADTSAVAAFSGCSGGTTRTSAPATVTSPTVTTVATSTDTTTVYYGAAGSFGAHLKDA